MSTTTPAGVGFDPDVLRYRYRRERDVRLRPDGIAQFVEVAGDFRHDIDDLTSTTSTGLYLNAAAKRKFFSDGTPG